MQYIDVPLSYIPINNAVNIIKVTATGDIRSRMQDLGLIEGAGVTPVHRSPFGTPTAYKVRGAVVALRDDDASKILVRHVTNSAAAK